MPETTAGTINVKLSAITSEFRAKMQEANKVLKDSADTMRKVRNTSAAAFAGLAAGIGFAVSRFADFESKMTKVAAVARAQGDEATALSAKARKLGQDTEWSASQVAEGMQFLAMAGNDAGTTMKAIEPVLKLASVGMIDLGRASDTVTNIMAGMGVGTDQLDDVVQKLTVATTRANTDVLQLGEAFKYAGPVASMAGMSFDEATAAMAMMGNAGIQGSLAGTSLRGAITRLLAPTASVSGVMEELGLKVKDGQGKMLPLIDILRQLEAKGADTAQIMTLFGLRAGPAMGALLEQGTDKLAEMTNAIENHGGAANDIMEEVTKTFSFQLKILGSKFDEAAISMGEAFAPALRDLNGLLGVMLDAFNALSPEFKSFLAKAVLGITVLAGLATVLASAALVLPALATGLAAVAAVVGTIALPVLVVGVAIAGMITLIGLFRDTWKDNLEQIKWFVSDFANNVMKAVDFIVQGWVWQFNVLKEFVMEWISSIANGLKTLVKIHDTIMGTDLAGALGAIGGAISGAGGAIGGAGAAGIEFVAEAGRELADTMSGIGDEIRTSFFAGLKMVGQWTGVLSDSASKTDVAGDQTEDALAGLKDALKDTEDATKKAGEQLNTLGEEAGQVTAAVTGGGAGPGGQTDFVTFASEEMAGHIGASSETIGVALDGVANVLSSGGEHLGATMQGFAQGFSAGGPIGGLIGAIIGLLTSIEGFTEILEVMNRGFRPVVEVIEWILEAIGPFIDTFGQFGEALGRIVFNMLPIRPILQMFGAVLGMFADAFEFLAQGMEEAANWFMRAWEDVMWEIGQVFRSIGLTGIAQELQAPRLQRAADQHVATIQAMTEATYRASETMDETTEALDEVGGEAAEGLEDMTEAANEATASLTNVPQGFKVAAARFAAISTEGLQGFGLSGYDLEARGLLGAGTGGMVINIENMTAANAQEFLDQLERELEWRRYVENGSPGDQAPDPGGR